MLQSAMDLLQIATAFFITKCDTVYFKLPQMKQSATVQIYETFVRYSPLIGHVFWLTRCQEIVINITIINVLLLLLLLLMI